MKEKYFGEEARVFLVCYGIVLPIIFISVLAVIARSTHKKINSTLAKSSGYSILAGATLATTVIMLFIICADAYAVHLYVIRNHEYKDNDVHDTFNLWIVTVTLAMDSVITLQFSLFLLYMIYSRHDVNDRCLQTLTYCLIPYFYAIFGNQLLKPWDINSKDKKNARIIWVLIGLMLAPLFSISSHIGYILVAWLTEPSKTAAIAIVQ